MRPQAAEPERGHRHRPVLARRLGDTEGAFEAVAAGAQVAAVHDGAGALVEQCPEVTGARATRPGRTGRVPDGCVHFVHGCLSLLGALDNAR